MQLALDTRISALIDEYPSMLDFLSSFRPEFQKLRNPVARATLGRIATVRMAAALAHVPPEDLLAAVRAEIVRATGHEPQDAAPDAAADARREELKAVVLNLHAGAAPAETRERFSSLLSKVGATELARMENELIQKDGLPAEEVRRLCDLHVEVFQPSLAGDAALDVAPGHPIHTFLAENRALEKLAADLDSRIAALGEHPAPTELEAQRAALAELLEAVGKVELHYQRKENQLFPYLEKRGVCGPPQVMWAIHDQVRAHLKAARTALVGGDWEAFRRQAQQATKTAVGMVYKEDHILFPMALELLDEAAWVEIRRGEAEIGYALVQPAAEWPARAAAAPAPAASAARVEEGALPLDTGALSLEMISLLFNHLPVEISFVDEEDAVRYYSRGADRIFPRSPGVIGRKVQNCHPPKSLATVNRILEDFRAGARDKAEFWIQMRGRFLLIRYFAVRDAQKRYRGCLEVTQDVTEIRKLEGERRLLDDDVPRA